MPETADASAQLAKVRARVAELRRKLDKRNETIAGLRRELAALRTTTLDVFPEHRPDAALAERIEAIRAEGLTFLTQEQVASLASCVLETEAAGRPGILIEAGTARGGSAIAMALAKSPERTLRVYDVFGLIPPPGEEDGEDVHARYADIVAGKATAQQEGEQYYGYRDDLLGEVTASFAQYGVPVADHAVELVQGLFEDTIAGEEPVALAHVDGDWFSSTMTCLERIAPRLVPGGRIVVDDYFTWSGCRDAVDQYFAGRAGFRVEMRAKVHIVRED